MNKGIQSGETVKYNGIYNTMARITNEEGFFQLWRGNMINVIRYTPTQALNMALLELNNSLFFFANEETNKKNSNFLMLFKNVLSGGLAGGQAQLILYPFDFARTRIGADIGNEKIRQFNGLRDFSRQIYKKEGILGFYKGFLISFGCTFVYRAIYFGMYNTAKKLYLQKSGVFKKFVFAQNITIFASLIAYPLDTVRRRLMMQSGRDNIIYRNSFDCFSKIYKEEGGVQALYKGGLSNVFRSLGGAFVLVIYDELKDLSRNKRS
ncbi:hypothetical protein IMG5_204160 [Ichthyophthirius multifiliis]|uniref:ADP/ATP translocase n=1 Tax=Ichthyophthirius multifiliis TaxID=5932 RepID=G0R6F3_ICHMU|nr:hypothetical protein IMG5_204160 [Ichthyophthirius multifiliis]EGR26965.1 hypothetical protein IMG5_204160 [Ichthyophthirius multifiliis]|eukprot:XP_004023849.1 hypothetical protein IMG5_204160 [Ichthyophthirius multifiliis]